MISVAGGVLAGGVVAGFAWLYMQDLRVRHELALQRQLLEARRSQQSEPSESAPGMAARLDRLESSLQELTARLETSRTPAVETTAGGQAQPAGQTAPEVSSQSSQPPKFSDPYVERDKSTPGSPTKQPVTRRALAMITDRIGAEGAAPERAESVARGFEQLTFSNPDLTSGLSFDAPLCSESRCAVRMDVSQTKFSKAKLSNDPDYEAEDAYYDFIKAAQDQIDNAMARKTRLSIYRSGDELVARIIPKQSDSEEGG